MGTLTIRNLDDTLIHHLRVRAAGHDRSMEAEARAILRAAIAQGDRHASGPLGRVLHERFGDAAGADLDIPPREPMRDAPAFD